MSARAVVLALCAIAAAPCAPLAGQLPAVIEGRVLDALAGTGVAAARVTVVESASTVAADAAGAFALRGVDPGRQTLHVAAAGYADTTVAVAVVAGRSVHVRVQLRPVPALLAGVDVRGAVQDGTRIDRAAIARSGARSAGDVVAAAAGVLVRATVAGGAQTASIRGSDPTAVLVLVDGVALNDPVTGVADLSTVAASSIASVTVLPGARSARFGPRAEAGVILIETRAAGPTLEAEASVGSLGAVGGRVQAGGAVPVAWTAGVEARTTDGEYAYALPVEAGGGRARRVNADAMSAGAFLSIGTSVAGGDLAIRAAGDVLRRGLPGRSYVPAPAAREASRRLRGSVRWLRFDTATSIEAMLGASVQRARFHDDDPPFGLPYDDTARMRQLDARVRVEHRLRRFALGGGVDVRTDAIRSTQLAADTPPGRWYGGVFANAAVEAGPFGLGGEVRIDGDPAGGAVASHAVTLRARTGGITAALAHRSSFSPPGLDDQFFRDAVGVEPNPDLRPERVPSELEASLSATRVRGTTVLSASIAAYLGDVRDMIVWAPDYRFVWSPRNVDVERHGAEATAALETSGVLRALRATYAWTRLSYAASTDDAQLEYRPRHAAQLRAEWAADAWSGALEAHYTGTRYPAAARVNALPGFWTLSADLGRRWRAGPWSVDTSVRVDRLLDETATLIFGFPDPGRTAELRVRIHRITSRTDEAS